MSEEHTYQGHHRVWHVFAPVGHSGLAKLAEPREPQLWFDRRCFEQEEQLLAALPALGMDGVPAVHELPGTAADRDRPLLIQDFIEGHTLAEMAPFGTPVPERHLRQIMQRFGQLASVSAEDVARCCEEKGPAPDRDARTFLRSLVDFTHEQVYLRWRTEYPELFDALQLGEGAADWARPLNLEADRLTDRPFCLLHGDLHRTNLVVGAADERLWTIDWELAVVGDPMYDLATHLHLMGYPPRQEAEVVQRWRETVPKVLHGADAGMDDDLPRYRTYKSVQSLFTDVVRHAHRVAAADPGELTAQLRTTGETVSALLRRAAGVLGPGVVASPREVAAAYREHVVSAAPAAPSAGAGPAGAAATRPGGRGAASRPARSGSG